MGRRLRRILAGILLVALAYGAFVALADGPRVLDAARRLPGATLVAALALTSAAYALRAMRWRLYLLRMPGQPRFADGFAAGLVSGKMGQVAKTVYLDRLDGVPWEASVPAGFAERIADSASALLLLAVGLALAPGGDLRLALAAGALVLLLVAALRSPILLALGRRLAARWAWLAQREARFERATVAMRAHLSARELAPIALLGLAAFLVESLALHVLAGVGLGLPVGPAEAMLVVGAADVAGLVSLVPGGVVAFEGSMAALLTRHGATLPEAAALTLAYRACTLWWSFLLSALAVAWLEAATRRRAATETS